MKAFFVNRTRATMRYHDLPGSEPAILFIHGLGCAGSFDYPQVAAQPALSGHRRLLIDLLGAGFSDKPESFSYSVEDHAAYLLDFVKAAGLTSFILFGHSLGGAVALSLANRCPDRVAALILSEANLDPSDKGSGSRLIADQDRNEFLKRGFTRLLRDSRSSGNAMWAASLALWSPLAAYLLSQSAARGGHPSWRHILYRLECPKTFIFGERSLPNPDAQGLAGHGIHIEMVNDAGHSMAWENPAGLAGAIARGIAAKI